MRRYMRVTAMTQLRPILTSLATARVSNAVTRVVNTSVNETLYDAGVDYDRLISLEKDNEGHITAVKSNMAEFNRLQSAAARGPRAAPAHQNAVGRLVLGAL